MIKENNIYIGLGSNLGDRKQMLEEALALMPPKILPVTRSHIYETPPWGYPDQPSFLNQVIAARTSLSAVDTLAYLKNIELELGRTQTFRYGPRVIDLDILFFNNEIINVETLTIPHPEISHRAFVLIPLCEIAPEYLHPEKKITICELAEQVNSDNIHIFDQE